MSGRAQLLVPDGWAPKRGSVVEVLPTKDDPVPPRGLWKLVDKAPGTGQWWAQPVDDAAREHGRRWPNQVISGCIKVGGARLVPKGYRPPRPTDLKDPGRLAR